MLKEAVCDGLHKEKQGPGWKQRCFLFTYTHTCVPSGGTHTHTHEYIKTLTYLLVLYFITTMQTFPYDTINGCCTDLIK